MLFLNQISQQVELLKTEVTSENCGEETLLGGLYIQTLQFLSQAYGYMVNKLFYKERVASSLKSWQNVFLS